MGVKHEALEYAIRRQRDRRPTPALRESPRRPGPIETGATMQPSDDRSADSHQLHPGVNRTDWLVISCVASGVAIVLTLTIVLLLLRRW
jgi:hypothetical protein